MEGRLEVWDVIQIKPGSGVENIFEGKLAIVERVTSYGCLSYIETFTGGVYIRLEYNQYAVIGKLMWVLEEDE